MPRTDRATVLAPAPPDAVWRALTDPARVARWLPPGGMTATVAAWEARPGGRLSLALRYPPEAGEVGKAGDGTDRVEGRFVAAEAPRRLEWATRFAEAGPGLAGEMTMAWTLSPEGDGTRIRLEARGVPDAISPQDHAEGMGATLTQLAAEAVRR